MPTRYQRRGSSNRGNWTQDSLIQAIAVVNDGSMGINEAAAHFGVPATTLRRRKKSGNYVVGAQGPAPSLGLANENKIVNHIIKLQKYGFAPSRDDVRTMAFKLAEQLKIKHRFNREIGKAGYDWLHLFMQRHPELSVRKSEGVSLARAQGMRHKEVDNYFKLLETVLQENQLFNKSGHIFNIDETGLQLNNKPGYVVAAKGSKNVAAITAGEKGETITVISCFNAEGVYIPPVCIFKGKNKKAEFEDGMPPGSKVYMNEKSAYINSNLLFQWLREQFLPRKPLGNIILLMDGHGSHCNDIEMLEFAANNEINMVCLPSHTTQFLQPLDRAFFKSLKLHYYHACNLFIKANPTRKLTRLQFGTLLSSAWSKAATVSNAVSAFKATGIVPYNPGAIPEEAFLSEEISDNNDNTQVTEERSDNLQPSCSSWNILPEPAHVDPLEISDLSPGKMLDIISPVPSTTRIQEITKRSRQLASILNSPHNILSKKSRREIKEKVKTKPKKSRKIERQLQKVCRKSKPKDAPSSQSISLHDSSEESDEDCCLECGEPYATTKKKDDWIRCMQCGCWFHETCSNYALLCMSCAKIPRKKK